MPLIIAPKRGGVLANSFANIGCFFGGGVDLNQQLGC